MVERGRNDAEGKACLKSVSHLGGRWGQCEGDRAELQPKRKIQSPLEGSVATRTEMKEIEY